MKKDGYRLRYPIQFEEVELMREIMHFAILTAASGRAALSALSDISAMRLSFPAKLSIHIVRA